MFDQAFENAIINITKENPNLRKYLQALWHGT
jgi:hypothetical protein